MSRSRKVFALLTLLVLTGLPFTAQPALSASAERPALQQVDKDSIDAYIHSRMQAASIPGLSLGVVYGDHLAYLKGYGVAGPDGRAVTPQTPFILGSTSKSITALAVMQLVEAGRIDLDAPVTKYLSWFRTDSAAASAQITVRNLLHQDSGLPTYEGRQGLWDRDHSSMALENGVRELSRVQLSRPAGHGYEYANENYNILGLIVQAVSGNSYEAYVRSSIFAPLEMSHSAAALSDLSAKDVASGFRYWLLWPVAFDAPYPRRMTPSGFLISSAEDMAHYLTAQLNGGTYGAKQLLSPQGIATLHAPGSKMSHSSSYGMGWVIQGHAGTAEIWHDGDVSNFHSNLLLLPDQHIGIVVLMNVGEFSNSRASSIPIEGVAAILLGNRSASRTNLPSTVFSQSMLLAPLLVVILWIAGSYMFVRRWKHRRELPSHGFSRFWRLGVPLGVDLSPLAVAWIVVPAHFRTPMETIALFAPDVFVVIVTISVLSLGWATVRTFVALRPRRLMNHASS